MPTLEEEPLLEADDIQGNTLRGFDTNHQELLGFKIDHSDLARPWLAELGERLDSLSEVHDYRMRRTNKEEKTFTQVLANAALSRYGLDAIGFNGIEVGDGLFNLAMGKLAGEFGDRVVDGQPIDYVTGHDRANTPDLLLILGCQDADALNFASAEWRNSAASAGLRLIYREQGSLLPGEIEHFGYRDGISQVGARGLLSANPPQPLTLRHINSSDPVAENFARPGQPLVYPGQFVFGYHTQDDDNPAAPGPKITGKEWMHNGSLLVFRRLRQDVAAFRQFLSEKSQELSQSGAKIISDRQLGASLVGRWEDGTPATISPDAEDQSISGDPMSVNHFAYGGISDVLINDENQESRVVKGHSTDEPGLRCPLFAHVRKVNPRNLRTDQGSALRTLKFQMMRRGIPYGPIYGQGVENADRGLLFLAYQTSFERQFKVLNNLWMNNPDAPEKLHRGHDLLVGQSTTGSVRFASFRDEIGNELARIQSLSQWVIPTGGGFFFSPSLNFFKNLAAA